MPKFVDQRVAQQDYLEGPIIEIPDDWPAFEIRTYVLSLPPIDQAKSGSPFHHMPQVSYDRERTWRPLSGGNMGWGVQSAVGMKGLRKDKQFDNRPYAYYRSPRLLMTEGRLLQTILQPRGDMRIEMNIYRWPELPEVIRWRLS